MSEDSKNLKDFENSEDYIEEDFENAEDFGFYGEEEEEEVIKDIKGVTDEVSKFVFTNVEYPFVCLKADIALPQYKWLIISKLVKQGVASKNISFYMLRGGELFKAGALSGVQIKSFIDIVGIDNLFGYHNENIRLEGDRLYVLSSAY